MDRLDNIINEGLGEASALFTVIPHTPKLLRSSRVESSCASRDPSLTKASNVAFDRTSSEEHESFVSPRSTSEYKGIYQSEKIEYEEKMTVPLCSKVS